MGLKPTSKVQYARNANRTQYSGGTAAATAKLMGLYSAAWQELHEISPVASLSGDLAMYHGLSADLHKVFELKSDATLTFEDAPTWFGMGMKGGVSGVGDGGVVGTVLTNNYVYTYTPSLASTDQADYYSLEVGDDTQAHRANGCFARSLEISFAVRDRTHIKADIAGRYLDANVGFTGGTAGNDRTVEEVIGQNWTVAIDDTGSTGTAGTIGTTTYPGCVVQGMWKSARFKEHDCISGVTYPGTVYPQSYAPELQLTVEVDSLAYSTLRAAYIGQTQQLIQLQNLGGTVHSGTPNATKQKAIQINGAYRIKEFGPIGGSDADGVQTVQITATGEYNSTLGYVASLVARMGNAAPA